MMFPGPVILLFLGLAHASFDACNRPHAQWAGANAARGDGSVKAAYNLADNVYLAGHQAGNLSWHHINATGYESHTGTPFVVPQHQTGSHADDGVGCPNCQNGWDATIVQIDAATGAYKGIFAVDTLSADGKYDDSSLNSGWGGYSFFQDMTSIGNDIVASGLFRGKLTFPTMPGANAVTLVNSKWKRYDGFLTKYSTIGTNANTVLWSSDVLQMPTCNQNVAQGTPDPECEETTSVGGAVSATSPGQHIITTSNYGKDRNANKGRIFLVNGANGQEVWKKDYSTTFLTLGVAAMEGPNAADHAIVVGGVKGENIDPFGTGTFSSCKDGDKYDYSVAVAQVDASVAGEGATKWAHRFGCGTAASIVRDPYHEHVYVGGHIEATGSGSPHEWTGGGTCTLTGALGGFIMKIDIATGACVWAAESPPIGYVSTRWGFRNNGMATDGTHLWTILKSADPVAYSATLTVPVRGSSDDGFLAKYLCTNGAGLWAESIGGDGDDELVDVVTTPSGVFIGGTVKSATVTLGPVTFKNIAHERDYLGATTVGTEADYDSQFGMLIDGDYQLECVSACATTDEMAVATGATLKPNYCLVAPPAGSYYCVANDAFDPFAPCFQCDTSMSTTTVQGPITTNYCYIDKICVPAGEQKPYYQRYNQNSVCEKCQPTVDTDDWSIVSGHFHDRDFALVEGRGGSVGCHSQINQINEFAIVFEFQSNGCQKEPAINPVAVTMDPKPSSLSVTERASWAIKEINAATVVNHGAYKAWLYYNGDKDVCDPATVTYVRGGQQETQTYTCVNTPANMADVQGEMFGTNLYYGQSWARMKTDMGLVVLQAQLGADPQAEPAKILDIKADAAAQILITMYQCVMSNAQCMDTCTTDSLKESAQTQANKCLSVIDQNADLRPADQIYLDNLFAGPIDGTNYYCDAYTILMRNLPPSSAWHYGVDDDTCKTEDGGSRGTSRDGLDQNTPVVLSNGHIEDLAKVLEKKHECHSPQVKDSKICHEKNLGRLVVSESDLGTLTDEPDKNCECPNCPSLSPPPPDDGLSDGEIAGIAVGAGVFAIIVIVLLALFVKSRKESKPMFSCLEQLNPKPPTGTAQPQKADSAPKADQPSKSSV
jgi:hypothetical protein